MKKYFYGLKKYRKLIILIFIVFFLIICFLLMPGNASDGIEYIKEAEAKDPTQFSDELGKKRKEERTKAIEEGKLDVFGLFDDYLILGDSRATGFYLYNYLLESRVYAYNGATILSVDEWLDSIQQLQPKNIYITFGMNDIKNNLNDTSEGTYSQLLSTQIKKILNICPQAQIYVNSIIPASKKVTAENEALWSQLDTYNNEIQKACKENDWVYIDNTQLANNMNDDLYESDGIHFVSSFYESWAKNMVDLTE